MAKFADEVLGIIAIVLDWFTNSSSRRNENECLRHGKRSDCEAEFLALHEEPIVKMELNLINISECLDIVLIYYWRTRSMLVVRHPFCPHKLCRPSKQNISLTIIRNISVLWLKEHRRIGFGWKTDERLICVNRPLSFQKRVPKTDRPIVIVKSVHS